MTRYWDDWNSLGKSGLYRFSQLSDHKILMLHYLNEFCVRHIFGAIPVYTHESQFPGGFNPLFYERISVTCNFPFIFIFCSCFQNSQIQMSCFRTWILLTCQAIAMTTFFLSLRITEIMCISPIPLTYSHMCGCTARILTLPFHRR